MEIKYSIIIALFSAIIIGVLFFHVLQNEYENHPCGNNSLSLVCEKSWAITRSMYLPIAFVLSMFIFVILSYKEIRSELNEISSQQSLDNVGGK